MEEFRDEEPIVCAASFLYDTEAEMAVSLLRSQGIKCFVARDDCGGWRPHMSFGTMVSVMLYQSDLEKAREILKEQDVENN
jgi:hypothetical protein